MAREVSEHTWAGAAVVTGFAALRDRGCLAHGVGSWSVYFSSLETPTPQAVRRILQAAHDDGMVEWVDDPERDEYQPVPHHDRALLELSLADADFGWPDIVWDGICEGGPPSLEQTLATGEATIEIAETSGDPIRLRLHPSPSADPGNWRFYLSTPEQWRWWMQAVHFTLMSTDCARCAHDTGLRPVFGSGASASVYLDARLPDQWFFGVSKGNVL